VIIERKENNQVGAGEDVDMDVDVDVNIVGLVGSAG
jgi:hypothetical protein